jgi:hypothetical protein
MSEMMPTASEWIFMGFAVAMAILYAVWDLRRDGDE